ncbi:MAG TPA: sigma-54 dependent transcriptional regulator [Polyangiaceae bacterium]|nr:sigma-54 dependent transcriptional regulator [Polyangiaceae bacterium]
MTTSQFAACVEPEATFAADEARTGPSSGVPTNKTKQAERGFWNSKRQIASASLATAPAPAAEVDAPGPGIRRGGPVRKIAAGSTAMRKVMELIEPLARSEVTITLIGETGTGKDVLARTVHQYSARRSGEFVVFDCGAVAPNLAESELFGHERGAFTGALAQHTGAFERAHGGTLFLDEVGELPLDLQTRLLRVLGSRCVRRVGGSADRPADVRVIAATNRDLTSEVAEGRFRQDLYFRLAAAVVQVPPLRERLEDIPLLTRRLLEDLGYADLEVSPSALQLLRSKSWPGNVRELKNMLACAVAFVDGEVLEPRHFSLPNTLEKKCSIDQVPLGGQKLEAIERAAISQTLALTRGNKARAAQLLGIAPSTLYEKLKKYRLGEANSHARE